MHCTWFCRTWQPSLNAHAYRLYLVKDLSSGPYHPRFALISEALYYSTFSSMLQITLKKTPNRLVGRFCCRSLTMTYFHTGIRTIIGAEPFHCPVWDGKEWYQLAMVVRHNLWQDTGSCKFIESISVSDCVGITTLA